MLSQYVSGEQSIIQVLSICIMLHFNILCCNPGSLHDYKSHQKQNPYGSEYVHIWTSVKLLQGAGQVSNCCKVLNSNP